MKHNFRSKYLSLLVILLAVVLVWISCPVYAINQSVLIEDLLPSWFEKIDPSVYENAEKKGEKYLVCIFRNDISKETINETVTRETRFDVSLYESDKFDTCIVPELERQIALFEQMNQMQSPTTRLLLGEPTVLTIEKAKQLEKNNYIAARRNVVKELNTENNDLFVKQYISDTSDIVYQGQYTSTFIAYLTKEEIEACAKSEEVVSIAPHQPSIPVIESDVAVEQIGVDSSEGTKSNLYNGGDGYRGDGIRIGVIELERGVCDITHPQLAGIAGTRLFVLDNIAGQTVLTPQQTLHATQVTTLIVGQRIELNGKVYEGVVPDATVYQIPARDDIDVVNAINILVNDPNNVSVINLSGGFKTGLAYDWCELEVDKLIESTDVTFVKSAGNLGAFDSPYVTSPGKAYNAITVGGAESKSMSGEIETLPYSVYICSSYAVDSFLTNKPDIVAPAQGFSFVARDPATGNLYIDTNYYSGKDHPYHGTSYAAPLVTGVVAQLQEADANLLDNPNATKAVLLAGADFDAISDNRGNDLWNYCYAARVKSGVGFLNAERAVRIAEAGNYDYNVYFLNVTSRYVEQSIVCEEVYIPANSKIRIVMTYSKPKAIEDAETFANGNDMDLDLFYQDGTWCESSLTPYNNVEAIEYVVDTAGTYSIEVYVPKLTQARLGAYIQRTVAWYIEPAS